MDTSSLAYTHVFYAARPAISERARLLTLCGPLIWLIHFLLKATFGDKGDHKNGDTARLMASFPNNRISRRYVGRRHTSQNAVNIRRRLLVFRILSRGLSSAQYMEKKARLFIEGRARVYGLRYWGSRLQRRAQLSCYDHGDWHAPQASAMTEGMWEAQLPPG